MITEEKEQKDEQGVRKDVHRTTINTRAAAVISAGSTMMTKKTKKRRRQFAGSEAHESHADSDLDEEGETGGQLAAGGTQELKDACLSVMMEMESQNRKFEAMREHSGSMHQIVDALTELLVGVVSHQTAEVANIEARQELLLSETQEAQDVALLVNEVLALQQAHIAVLQVAHQASTSDDIS